MTTTDQITIEQRQQNTVRPTLMPDTTEDQGTPPKILCTRSKSGLIAGAIEAAPDSNRIIDGRTAQPFPWKLPPQANCSCDRLRNSQQGQVEHDVPKGSRHSSLWPAQHGAREAPHS